MATQPIEQLNSFLRGEISAVETYRQMITVIGDKAPSTRRLLEEVLNDEEEHAEDMKDLLDE